MPLYDYQCSACQQVTEVRHGAREAYDGVCPACGGALNRVFNPAGIVFKGSGFYVNDSRKSAGGGDAPSPSASGDTAKKSDASASGDAAKKPDASPAAGGDGGGAKKTESSAA